MIYDLFSPNAEKGRWGEIVVVVVLTLLSILICLEERCPEAVSKLHDHVSTGDFGFAGRAGGLR